MLQRRLLSFLDDPLVSKSVFQNKWVASFTFGLLHPGYVVVFWCYVGRQIVIYSVLRVANNRALRTTAPNDCWQTRDYLFPDKIFEIVFESSRIFLGFGMRHLPVSSGARKWKSSHLFLSTTSSALSSMSQKNRGMSNL